MTAQILAAELGNLIQDSKRKNTELKNAAEKALQDLKSLSVTSEAQLSADLSRRPHFISPFLIACDTHNAKFGSTGISCLQRLSVSKALPRERLTEVLSALKDSVSLSHDVQLKILQILPSIIQNYPGEVRGDSLAVVLQICSALQSNKNFAVSNTAAATLQQLVIAVYDRVLAEDEKSLEIPTVTEAPVDDGTVSIRPAAHDAVKVFSDLNLLLTGERTTFVRFSPIPSTATLEVIEVILSNHAKVMTTHAEQIHILRSLLMPTIIRSLSDRLSFPITLRIIRVLNLLIRNHLTIMPSECEIALGLLNHMLDPEASNSWKRALCLEVFRGIYSDSRLLLQIYSHFDEQEGKKNIFGDNLASFVRLATEKPAVIGLGQQSSLPTSGRDSSSEQAFVEAGALAGVIGGPMNESNTGSQPAGISVQWSNLKTPCIEHLDKSEPPVLPETYIYSLVLTCITNVSESLAKFVLPLTVHHEGKGKRKNKTEESSKPEPEATPAPPASRKLSRAQSFRRKTIPVNPLSLEDHPAYAYVRTSATLVTECWPAILATCSTFLNAALDTDYYRALVRAIQKVTQVAGLLVLSTPRDAFLTTLAKAAVPSSMVMANVASPKSPPAEHSSGKGLLNVESLMSQASSALERNRGPSHEANVPTLGARNLLCLRALLNLAIALGPTLHSAWSIVFETLQVADLVMALSNQGGLRTPGGSRVESDLSSEKIEAETSAVQAAARRLFESTVDFPNESFVEILRALCGLVQTGNSDTPSGEQTPTPTTRPKVLHQRRLGSVSGISLNTDSISRDSAFALNKIGELAGLNEERLASYPQNDSGWDVFVAELVRYSANDRNAAATRLLAADILCRTVKEIAQLSISEEDREDIQARILSALQTQISSLHQDSTDKDSYADTDVQIHQIALAALKSVIEQCGESLVAGWVFVFDSLLSVFSPSSRSDSDEATSITPPVNYHLSNTVHVVSKTLARTAFGTVQLVCSDFLTAVPETSLSTLLELLLKFSCQQEDLNMSLTAVTFFWNISDFLHARSDLSQLTSIVSSATEQEEVQKIIETRSKQGTTPSLWLLVLLNLSTITTDQRSELRNTAIQTIQRIFENYVDQLSPEAWMLCLRSVLFGMVEANLTVQSQLRAASSSKDDEITTWNETTKTVLDSVSKSISMYMDKVEDADRLGEAWSALLDQFQRYFDCGSHALGASVFRTMTEVFSRMNDTRTLGTTPLVKTATIWTDYFQRRHLWSKKPEDNQEAFVAYAEAFKTIYRLVDKALTPENLIQMLRNLETCVVESDEVPYFSDVDNMTTLQTSVIECFSLVRTDVEGIPQFLLKTLSNFVVLPYSAADKRSPTFVAVSKASMTLLQTIVTKHVSDAKIYADGALLSVFTGLEKPIREKYIWHREGKSPTIWQKATSTAVAIVSPTLPHISKLEGEPLTSLWTQIIAITNGVTRATLSAYPPTREKDEAFDINAFTNLRSLITLPLGSSALPDSLRRTYTRNLFETSLLHAPAAGEIPDLASAPLADLYRVRLGRTDDPASTFRPNVSYTCLASLFALVAHHDGSSAAERPARIKLAQAAAPYLILRCALPLRAYIADHPLRGRMPQPESMMRELLFVLRELGMLESEPAAIPDAEGVRSRFKKHLHRLYPLVVRAVRVARGDVEVFGALVGLVDAVGEEFGVVGE